MNSGRILPRLVRLRDAPFYVGMDRNRFNKEVRLYLTEIPIGDQGIAFDRLDLDAWVYDYKSRNGRPGRGTKEVSYIGQRKMPGLRKRGGVWHIEKRIKGYWPPLRKH